MTFFEINAYDSYRDFGGVWLSENKNHHRLDGNIGEYYKELSRNCYYVEQYRSKVSKVSYSEIRFANYSCFREENDFI